MNKIAILTVSDTRTLAEDGAGDRVEELLRQAGYRDLLRRIVTDDRPVIEEALLELTGEGCSLILTAGGTGVGPRDVTPEATAAVAGRFAPGIAEMLRAGGAAYTSRAWLSRGIAVLRGSTLIVNLPGSTKGAGQSCEILLPSLEHLFKMLGGGGH